MKIHPLIGFLLLAFGLISCAVLGSLLGLQF